MKTLCVRRKKGFTIIELVVCIGITAFFFAAILALLMSIVMQNRMTQLQVAGLMAARSTAEEILSIANSADRRAAMKGSADSTSSSAIQYLSYLKESDYLASLGLSKNAANISNGKIELDYYINTVGFAPRDQNGKLLRGDADNSVTGEAGSYNRIHDGKAKVKVTIYLNESDVPKTPNGSDVKESLWEGAKEEGFDMNGDGKIDDGSLIDSNLHWALEGVNSNYRRITQMPVDIQVTMNHPGYRGMSYSTDYRVIISDFTRE